MASPPPEPLARQLAELQARMRLLEEAVKSAGIPIDQPSRAEEPARVGSSAASAGAAQPAPEPASSGPAHTAPLPAFTAAGFSQATQPTPSLESRIGSQWFNRIGILAVLIGASWFLKLAIDRGWIGPAARVLIGIVAGGAIFAVSELFERRRYLAFSLSLKALATGILYLSLWASFSLFHLVPSTLAFLGMAAVTALNGILAWRKNSELLALYGIVGGFSTPALLSTGVNDEFALFSYLLLLDLALLTLAVVRPWARLVLGAALGTALYAGSWWLTYAHSSPSVSTTLFVLAFLLLFALAPRLLHPRPAPAPATISDTFTLAVVPTLAGALAFAALRDLFVFTGSFSAPPYLALAFAALFVALHRLPARPPLQPLLPVTDSTYLTTSVLFLTLALELRLQGRTLTLAWLAEGAALLTTAARARSLTLRVLGTLSLALGLAALLLVHPRVATTPFLNQRFATYVVGIAIFAYTAVLARRSRQAEADSDPFSWHAIRRISTLLVSLLTLVALAQEIHSYWFALRLPADPSLAPAVHVYAQFSYSTLFMLSGAVLLLLGFARHSPFTRWQALILLAATIAKVFLVDLTTLAQGYRALSFLGLGALLLAVSFTYQRDWLRLRRPEP